MNRSTIKNNSIDFYLEKITEIGFVEFDCIKVHTTAGDIRPPYPFQYIAYTKIRQGDDDPFEGVGGSPLEAVKDLYRSLKDVFT